MGFFDERDNLPCAAELERASLYSKFGRVSNVTIGVKDGHEFAVFDFDSNSGEMAHTDTVVAIKAASPRDPVTWLSRSSGLQLERVGEWIFAWERDRRLDSDQYEGFVGDVLNLLTYASDFPQNR